MAGKPAYDGAAPGVTLVAMLGDGHSRPANDGGWIRGEVVAAPHGAGGQS